MQIKLHLIVSFSHEGDIFVLSSLDAGTSRTDPGSLCNTVHVSVHWHCVASWLNTTKSVSVEQLQKDPSQASLSVSDAPGGIFWLSAEAIHGASEDRI